MDLAVLDLIAIIMTIAGMVTALSVLYTKFIKPIKKVVKQVEDNTKAIKDLEDNKVVKQVETNTQDIKNLEDKISKIKTDRVQDDIFNTEVRAVLFESLIAILDGLEQGGANHTVTEQKKKLIKFMSQQLGSKKKK